MNLFTYRQKEVLINPSSRYEVSRNDTIQQVFTISELELMSAANQLQVKN
jgi:hypothetical protein